MIDANSNVLSINEQCSIIGLPRSVYYEKRSSNGDEEKKREKQEKEAVYGKRCDTVLCEWTEYDTYGYIKMSKHLLRQGFSWATEFTIRRIYKELGLHGVSPRFITTRVAKGKHGKYHISYEIELLGM